MLVALAREAEAMRAGLERLEAALAGLYSSTVQGPVCAERSAGSGVRVSIDDRGGMWTALPGTAEIRRNSEDAELPRLRIVRKL